MPEKTANYKLNQWKKEDDFLMKDFNDDNAAIEDALTDLQSAVDSKAAKSEVDTLKSTVGTKANQSDLNSLTSTVNTKAAQSELNSLKNTVNGKVGIVVGSYEGDDVNGRNINLGFQPKAVFIATSEGLSGSGRGTSSTLGGLILPGKGLYYNTYLCAEIISTGFRLYDGTSIHVNDEGTTYYYLAIR